MSNVTKPEYTIAGQEYYQQKLSGGQLNLLASIFSTIPYEYIDNQEIGKIVLHLIETSKLPKVLSILLIPVDDQFTDDPVRIKSIEKEILSEDAVELISIGKGVVSDFLSVNRPSLKRLGDIFPAASAILDGLVDYVDSLRDSMSGMKSTSE